MWKPAVCYQCRIIWIITRPDVSTAEVSSVQEHWVRQASLQIKVTFFFFFFFFFPLTQFQKSFLGTLRAIASHPWQLHCHGNILTCTLGTTNHLSELGDDTNLTKWQLFRAVVVILSDCLPFTDGSAPKTTQPPIIGVSSVQFCIRGSEGFHSREQTVIHLYHSRSQRNVSDTQ